MPANYHSPVITASLDASQFLFFTLNSHICKLLLSLALITTEKEALYLLPAGLRIPPLLKAKQAFLHLISMQQCQRGFCSE